MRLNPGHLALAKQKQITHCGLLLETVNHISTKLIGPEPSNHGPRTIIGGWTFNREFVGSHLTLG